MPPRRDLKRSLGLGLVVPAYLLAAPGGAATVEITVSGVTPNGGAVLASLCSGTLEPAACSIGNRQSAVGSVVSFVFSDVEPGRYAALAFQDSAGDGVLRRSRMGRPLEPYGLSNGAGRSHSPSFEQAAVSVGETGARIGVRLDPPARP